MATSNRRNKNSRKAALKYSLLALLGIALMLAWFVFGPNTGSFASGDYLYVRSGSKYEDVLKAMKEGGFIGNASSFDMLARRAGYPAHIHPGKYRISRGQSNYSLVRMLRSGRQEEVKLVINKVRTKADFIRLISTSLEADSATLKQMLSDNTYLSQFGLDTATAMCAVVPATYRMYWNTSADKAFQTIEKSYAKFWTDDRKALAQSKGLTPQQAIITASIVDEETNNKAEKGTVASVYLNRLKQGMKLQADPTARYAGGDFTIRRITSAQTGIASPYNTYYVSGLPIGPICTPASATVDAVLNAPATTYLFFCAKGDGSSTHTFSTTYAEHLKAANALHEKYDARGVH